MVVGLVANNMVSKAMKDTTVVVAKHDIEPFTQIKTEDLKKVTRPASGLPNQVATSMKAVAGNFTTTTIVKGNAIQKEHLALPGNGDLSSVLTNFDDPSVRGFALPSENPMIKNMQPGNQVDLYVQSKDGNEPSFLLADNVLVLGIAKDDDNPVGLILALSQEQVKKIVPVMNDIQIALVPYNAQGATADKDDKGDEQEESETEGGDK